MADDRLCNYLIVNSNKVCKGEEVRSKQLVGKKAVCASRVHLLSYRTAVGLIRTLDAVLTQKSAGLIGCSVVMFVCAKCRRKIHHLSNMNLWTRTARKTKRLFFRTLSLKINNLTRLPRWKQDTLAKH